MELNENVLKNLRTYKNLCEELQSDKVFHATLFYSPDVFTNYALSKLFAKLLLCENKNCCDICGSCKKVDNDSNPDYLCFKDSRFSTSDVEKILQDQALKPMISDCKVYQINSIDNATVQAQNKLLKVLEEPNKNVYFILNATNLDNVLPTIKSRCKIRMIEPFEFEELQKIMQVNNFSISKSLYEQSGGYLGSLNDLTSNHEFDDCVKLSQEIVFELKNSKQVIQFSSRLGNSKNNFILKLSLLQSEFRHILLKKLNQNNLNFSQDYENKIEAILDDFTTQALIEIISEIDESKKKFEANVNINMICDSLLMKILEVKYLCKQK